jgi:hypothetical protein
MVEENRIKGDGFVLVDRISFTIGFSSGNEHEEGV